MIINITTLSLSDHPPISADGFTILQICDSDEIAMIPVPAHQIGPGEVFKWDEGVVGCISDLVLLHCCLVYLNRMNGITVPDQSLTCFFYMFVPTY